MNILFIGDISGRPGRNAVKKVLPQLHKKYEVDLTIANIENASSGFGITEENYRDLRSAGIDVCTSGNHIWAKKEVTELLDDPKEPLIRPANYPSGVPGKSIWSTEIGSTKVVVANLMGRVFMKEGMDDPFRAVDEIIKQHKDSLIIIDFHAEATSEKRAFGFYVDGKVSAVVGTHTHVPTADAQILPEGTAYITDVGFCGPHQSVLGVDKEIIINQFLTAMPQSYEIPTGEVELNMVLLKTKGNNVTSIEHLRQFVEL